jgi:hypothetical protein
MGIWSTAMDYVDPTTGYKHEAPFVLVDQDIVHME